MTRTFFYCLAFIATSTATGRVSLADAVEYSSGHADIGLAYEDDELHLHYHFGSGAVIDGSPLVGEMEFDPADASVRVGSNAMVTTTGDVPFLGTFAGDSVWLIPQSSSVGIPFLGIAAEELDATFSSATMTMTSFSGPGQFALWQTGGIGGTNVYWQSNNGLDVTDTLDVAIGGHDHYSYGFTAEGIYDVEISAVANLAAGGSVSDVGTFRFIVGDVTAIPEPSSLASLGLIGMATVLRRRKRRS
ncbi:choice-of-anchor M domain-containing protein [Stieleria sp. JC731]|uniref:choice-of-anchor M domain-containing protein n=1 Tax=Pirellulaceae TaxID=2691357 RepID=UPI001E3F25D0|nr:choice-of-anchor M domain-containing protein [Stieleria sp. JC731]MCC9600318.1 choice-of-anchor M domain-containing protein [Stieleria sp. JC731]